MSERPPAPPPGDQPPPITDPPPGGGSPPGAAAPPPPSPPPSPPPPPVAARRVYRRTQGRVIAGVAGGIADYLGIEAWVVRIGFVVLVPFGGFGALAYLIAWLLMPPAGGGQSLVAGVLGRPSSLRSYLGVGLILLAVAILASAFSEPGVIWAMALIAFGIFLFRQDPEPSPPGQRLVPAGEGAAAGSAATTVPVATAATATTEPLPRPPAADQATTTLPGPPDIPVWTPPPDQTATWGGPPPLPPDHPAATWGAPPPRAPRRRPFLGPLTFAVALIVTGLVLVLDNLDVVDLGFGQVLAVFLTVLGGGLLVGTWWGRAWGLIPVGLLALPVVALAMLAGPVPVEGGVAERLFQPRTPAEVRSSYRLAGGELILDLSAVRFGQGQPPVQASIAGGRLLVVLPDEVAAEIRGRVGVGSLDLLGHVDTGAQVDSVVTEPAARPPAKGAAPTVDLDLQAGYGVIEVRRASDPRSIHEAGPFEDTFPPPPVPPTTPVERP